MDYDEYGIRDLRYASDLLDIVRMDARRLIEFPEMGGVMVIKRSMQGYHLRAPLSRLTREEYELALLLCRGDTGFKWWSLTHGKATLRISEKVIVKQIGDRFVGRRIQRDTPQVIEVIRNG